MNKRFIFSVGFFFVLGLNNTSFATETKDCTVKVESSQAIELNGKIEFYAALTTVECKGKFAENKFNEMIGDPKNIKDGEQMVWYPDRLGFCIESRPPNANYEYFCNQLSGVRWSDGGTSP